MKRRKGFVRSKKEESSRWWQIKLQVWERAQRVVEEWRNIYTRWRPTRTGIRHEREREWVSEGKRYRYFENANKHFMWASFSSTSDHFLFALIYERALHCRRRHSWPCRRSLRSTCSAIFIRCLMRSKIMGRQHCREWEKWGMAAVSFVCMCICVWRNIAQIAKLRNINNSFYMLYIYHHLKRVYIYRVCLFGMLICSWKSSLFRALRILRLSFHLIFLFSLHPSIFYLCIFFLLLLHEDVR